MIICLGDRPTPQDSRLCLNYCYRLNHASILLAHQRKKLKSNIHRADFVLKINSSKTGVSWLIETRTANAVCQTMEAVGVLTNRQRAIADAMKFALFLKLAALTATAITSIIPSSPVKAANFDEQEVDQEQFIAVAVPFGENQYNLLIVEQIPGKQQCWSESGSTPITVEPLLLNFDFTGHCRRSTDSNGYSIRIDSQDYGLDYLLRIIERNGELVLVGTPRKDPNQPEILVGRTHGLGDFLKIFLNPGWQFTKRAYEGKTLGHVYFSGNSTAMNNSSPSALPSSQVSSLSSPGESLETPVLPETGTSQTQSSSSNALSSNSPLPAVPIPQSPPSAEVVEIKVPNLETDSQPLPIPQSSFSSEAGEISVSPLETSAQSLQPLASPQSSSQTEIEEIPLAPSEFKSQSGNLPLVPLTPPSQSLPQTEATDIVVPSGETNSQPAPPPANQPTASASPGERNLSDLLVVSPRPQSDLDSGASNSDRVPVPNNPIPEADLDDLSSTTPMAESGSRGSYRVMVEANNTSQEAQVRSLYPDAFPTVYNGQSLLQVGVFSSQENADKTLRTLKDMGLSGIIAPF